MKKLLQVVIMTLLAMLLSGACAYAQMYQVTTDTTAALPDYNNGRTIVKDGGGNYYSVYTATYSGYAHVFVRKSTDNGATWQYWDGATFNTTGTETPIETSGSYAQSNPSIAVDNSNNVHVVWHGKSSTSTSYTQIRYSMYNGSSWSSPVDITSESNNQYHPSITIDTSNNIHVSWEGVGGSSSYQIKYSKYNGSSWSSPVNIIASSLEQYRPSTVVDSSNNVHMIWCGGANDTRQLYYSKYSEGSLFLASKISSIPELNFSSTPFPLLGFHG